MTSPTLIAATTTLPAAPGGVRALLGIAVVLGLVCLLAWLAKRGVFAFAGGRGRGPIAIESAVALGERRSLVVVAIEGRRLLLGITPVQVSFVTELAAAPGETFAGTLDRQFPPGSGA